MGIWKRLYHTDPITCQKIWGWFWVTRPLQAATLAIACGNSPLVNAPIVLPPIVVAAPASGPFWPGEGYYPEPFAPNAYPKFAGLGNGYFPLGSGISNGGQFGGFGGGGFSGVGFGSNVFPSLNTLFNTRDIPPSDLNSIPSIPQNVFNMPSIPITSVMYTPDIPDVPNVPSTPITPTVNTPEPNSIYVMLAAMFAFCIVRRCNEKIKICNR